MCARVSVSLDKLKTLQQLCQTIYHQSQGTVWLCVFVGNPVVTVWDYIYLCIISTFAVLSMQTCVCVPKCACLDIYGSADRGLLTQPVSAVLYCASELKQKCSELE